MAAAVSPGIRGALGVTEPPQWIAFVSDPACSALATGAEGGDAEDPCRRGHSQAKQRIRMHPRTQSRPFRRMPPVLPMQCGVPGNVRLRLCHRYTASSNTCHLQPVPFEGGLVH